MKLNGLKAVITGASRGLGRSIAESFLADGATVLICSRNAAELQRVHADLEISAPGRVHSLQCDVASESDIDALAAEAAAKMSGTDILVANAGIYGPKGAIDELDWSAWVDAIRVNLTGTVYCTRAFLPLLRASKQGKILLLSGGGATKPLPFLSAYAASKAALVRFGETLAEELRPAGIDVNMIAPGALNTAMLDEVIAAGPSKVGEAFYRSALRQQQSGGTPLSLGASLCVYLASTHGITGRLISAQWDPWKHFEEIAPDLAATDIYTLRRIVPADRAKDWDEREWSPK